MPGKRKYRGRVLPFSEKIPDPAFHQGHGQTLDELAEVEGALPMKKARVVVEGDHLVDVLPHLEEDDLPIGDIYMDDEIIEVEDGR